jgi:hypothetical protein
VYVCRRHELKIAVDIDGVLADQVGAVLKVIETIMPA